METLMEFNQTYIKKIQAYYKKEEKISQQITELKNKEKRLKYPHITKVFMPIAEKIKDILKADGIQHYGPFGLCSENSFYWVKDDKKSITDKGNVIGGITLIHSKEGWAIRNEGKKVGHFATGTIGEMNGMNYETIEITDKMNLDWLVDFVKRGMGE